jgi:manganese transport protein
MRAFSNTDASLSEVHESVDTTLPRSKWRRILSFFGPAYLVSVGYMDPGNWATDLEGGSKYGYALIWVLLMSNIMALLLQSLSARLGIVRGRDLAQANREAYPRSITLCLYVLAEIAIAATDLAEVLGMAIGLQLLTGVPLLWGVGITVLDTFLLLFLQRLGMRKMEAFIIALVAIIGVCFLINIIIARPNLAQVATGLAPSLPDSYALFIAIGIIGATVMPHNLYLHSALVQTRKIKRDDASIKRAIKLNFIDSAIALNLAFFVNAAILVLAATVFFKQGRADVASISDAHELLAPLTGASAAPYLFAIALIAAGQSSTITGTLAGQIVMEGYLRLRINPWMRRLLTRLLAIVPAMIVILISGEGKVEQLLVFSQVILSLQLAFAIIPLIHFVSDKTTMGRFVIHTPTKIFAWLITVVIVFLNLRLVSDKATGLFESEGLWGWKLLVIAAGLFFIGLLLVTIIYPLLKKQQPKLPLRVHPANTGIQKIEVPRFEHIAVALDFSANDEKILSYAVGQGHAGTRYLLIHIVESAGAKILGPQSDDYETRRDQEQLDGYAKRLQEMGYNASPVLGYNDRALEIVRLATLHQADLLVIGGHGHSGVKDFLYGETINRVRHELKIPVLVVNL